MVMTLSTERQIQFADVLHTVISQLQFQLTEQVELAVNKQLLFLSVEEVTPTTFQSVSSDSVTTNSKSRVFNSYVIFRGRKMMRKCTILTI